MLYSLLYPLIGLFVTTTPFVLVRLFKNRLNGFFTILTVLSFVHLCTALITQSTHTFSYEFVLSIHSIVLIVALYIYKKNKYTPANTVVDKTKDKTILQPDKTNSEIFIMSSKQFMLRNWFVLLMIFLGAWVLYSIRFDYSGIVDTSFGTKQVVHSQYTYPLYSDEWIGSSLVSYSIESKYLPLVNPLNANSPFINFLFVSHSVFAELILILGLNPLTQYTYLAILNTFFLSLAVYVISRLNNVRKIISIIVSLSVLFITNSGNLPSTWFILPYSAALTLYLFSIIGFLLKNRIVLFVNLILSVLLYPPFIVFAIPFLLGTSYGRKVDLEKIRFFIIRSSILFILSLGVITLIALQSFSFSEIFQRAVSFVIRPSLDTGKVSFEIWNIIPLYIIPFIPFGLFFLVKNKKKYLYFPIIVGTLFWIYYSFTTMVFLIEPSRIITVSSVLFLIAGGIGMEYLYTYITTHTKLVSDLFMQTSLKIIVSLFFILYVLNLPRLGLWHKLPMQAKVDNQEYSFIPSPPITRYLQPDDLKLFSGYTHKVFIAPSWKGLVVGVATKNYPLDSKSSTLTNNILNYSTFMQASCENKRDLIKRYKIDLVYSRPIECPNLLKFIGTSEEGLSLYKTEL